MKHSRLAAWLLGFPGLLLAIAFILISMHQNNLVQNHQANDFTFEKDALCIKGTGLSDKLAYSSMKKIECVNKVETVRPVDEAYFNGIVEIWRCQSLCLSAYEKIHCDSYPKENLYYQ